MRAAKVSVSSTVSMAITAYEVENGSGNGKDRDDAVSIDVSMNDDSGSVHTRNIQCL